MCGIWGISNLMNTIDNTVLKKTMEKLMVLSESRGKEASGIAIMQENDMVVLRKAIPATKMIQDYDYSEIIRKHILNNTSQDIFVSGHSRLVTNGTQYSPDNNQPVAKHDMSLVHNGIIVNSDEIWSSNTSLKKDSEVDSEAIVELCHYYLNQGFNTKNALGKVYAKIIGTASTICLTRRDKSLIAASNNGSLYYCRNKSGSLVIFASERLILERLLKSVRELRKIIPLFSITQVKQHEFITIKSNLNFKHSDMILVQDTEKKSGTTNTATYIEDYSKFDIDFDKIKKIRRCSKCVLPETFPFIKFDENGVCNYCKTYKKKKYYGMAKLQDWASKQEPRGHNKTMVSFSGGRDSSYGLHYFVKELGLKPVAYCYDWGMVTDLARRNQSRMCSKLGVELLLVSADIKTKRNNIRKNVAAWLNNPDLGMIPLFMAGDKHYFYYANKLCKDYNIDSVLLASNPFEITHFKTGFCGVKPDILNNIDNKIAMERLSAFNVTKLANYYAKQYVSNTKYINSSIIDTISAAASYYIIPHNYFRLFDYIPWNEKEVDKVLLEEYDWEHAKDTNSTWRIGDGTAPFYNYIYCMVAGFTENDTLRSNQIREGMLTREDALELIYTDNLPRYESMQWYFDAIHIDMKRALSVIGKIPKLYF